MNATMKIKIPVRAERMPIHMLTAPSDAPACYGDAVARAMNRACASCPFNSRCTDFVDRACVDRNVGIRSRSDSTRGVWRPDAPLVVRPTPPKNGRSLSAPLGGPWGQRTLHDLVSMMKSHVLVQMYAGAAAKCGLITTDAAVELALRAGQFYSWAWENGERERLMIGPRALTLVWLTKAIAQRALLGQGRPEAMRPGLHYQLFVAMEGPILKPEGLRSRVRRLPKLHERFEREVHGMATLPSGI